MRSDEPVFVEKVKNNDSKDDLVRFIVKDENGVTMAGIGLSIKAINIKNYNRSIDENFIIKQLVEQQLSNIVQPEEWSKLTLNKEIFSPGLCRSQIIELMSDKVPRTIEDITELMSHKSKTVYNYVNELYKRGCLKMIHNEKNPRKFLYVKVE